MDQFVPNLSRGRSTKPDSVIKSGSRNILGYTTAMIQSRNILQAVRSGEIHLLQPGVHENIIELQLSRLQTAKIKAQVFSQSPNVQDAFWPNARPHQLCWGDWKHGMYNTDSWSGLLEEF